jgi:beta-lactamase regulating signal transducer with metallopeptidase domain
MAILVNSVLLNAFVATGLAVLVWTAAAVPVVRRRPALRHALWLIVLLKLVTPPVLEVAILPASFVVEAKRSPHPGALSLGEVPRDGPVKSSVAPTRVVPREMPQSVRPALRIDGMVVLAVVSALGTLMVLLLVIKQLWRLGGTLARAALNDNERLGLIAQQSAEHMGLCDPPAICAVSANVSPLLWARRSGPLVVIPRRLLDQMSDEQLGCIVSHEIAHYLRRDHWTNLLSLLIAAICWWNPVVWWARRELRSVQEVCCDALVISRSVATRRVYGETLFQVLEFLQAEGSLSPALASSFGSKSSTRRRFEMIANPQVNHRLSWWSYPLLLGALAGLLFVPVHGQSDEPKESKAPQRTRPLVASGGDDKNGDVERNLYRFDDATESKRNSHTTNYRLPDYLPAAHGNAVSAGGDHYYVLTPYGSDRIWYVQFTQDRDDGSGKILWDAMLKLPAEDELKQGDTFALSTSKGIIAVAVVEDDYVNDRDIGVKQIDVKTGAIKDERTLLRHMARYQSFLPLMRGNNDAKGSKNKAEER